MDKRKIPIIVGAAQFTQRKDTSECLDPLSLMDKTSKMAIDDTQSNEILDSIDAIYMMNISSWSYKDAPGELSTRLGIKPIEKNLLPDGGHFPQMLVNRAAKAISSGKLRSVLITGGEAAYTIFKKFKNQKPSHWPPKKEPDYMEQKLWDYANEIEKKYGITFAPLTYAIFETAFRSFKGRNPQEHLTQIGRLFEQFSHVASKNPYSWSNKEHSADQIIISSPNNRRIDYPYTKRMCANYFVDQSASILITSEKEAISLNISRDKWVYPMGGADLFNVPNVTQRPELFTSPAIREASRLALKQAGIKLKDINAFDLYSCFPSIVEIIMNELGLNESDSRNLTITGGLPFFGGPLSTYSLHSIVNTVEVIRKNNSLKVMVVANGGYNTKESVGIYGSNPPKIPWEDMDFKNIQKSILNNSKPQLVEKANGKLTIDGYTIYYNRLDKPEWGLIIGTLENQNRCLAIIKGESDLIPVLESQEIVGRVCSVIYDSIIDRNIVTSLD
jgi:acetyl-CoA C-acetyltransferase